MSAPARPFSQIGVFTGPGATMTTSMPNIISSRRRLSDNPSSACLEAGEAAGDRASRAPADQHGRLVGDVENQGGEIGAELALETVRIGLLADAAEHAKALVQQ